MSKKHANSKHEQKINKVQHLNYWTKLQQLRPFIKEEKRQKVSRENICVIERGSEGDCIPGSAERNVRLPGQCYH